MPDSTEKPLVEAFRAGGDSYRNRRPLIVFLIGIAILIVSILRHNPSSGLIGFLACATVAWLARKYQL
jgi:hypothetical protein